MHSEIIWALSPNNNVSRSSSLPRISPTCVQITEAIRRFGVSDTATSLFVVRVGGPGTSIEDDMKAVVAGDVLPLADLPKLTDWATVKKVRRAYAGYMHPSDVVAVLQAERRSRLQGPVA